MTRRTDPPDNRILVKLRPSASLGAAERSASLRPLFEDATHDGMGAAGEARWFVAELGDGAETPWDLAHARVADQLGVAASDVVFAEPDLVHDIYPDPTGPAASGAFAIAPDCDNPRRQNDNGGAAIGPTNEAWHLDKKYSQLGAAREAVNFTTPRTRVAHLDTGYSRRHAVRPPRVLRHIERSFVEADGPGASAEDPDRDVFLLDNSGHGTGTISVLAGGAVPAWNGKLLGGVPEAEVLPLRIADSVVLLKTSSFATALDYAIRTRCDVLTMSMGGLPSALWRETVDRAYVRGMCMVAAAGNNFNGLPTRKLVYPARYGRVIAVCGAMADGKAYSGLRGLKTMEGNYGPRSKMKYAMAAYTPNIPWAVFGCDDAVRLDGGGTSSATPQVAAAAALWFEKYKHELPRDWRRVEAVRHALFSTARKKDKKRLGNGILRALDALAVSPVLGLSQTKSDSDWFALLRVLTGWGFAAANNRDRMFGLELQHRWLLSEELQELIPDPDAEGELGQDELRKVMDVLINDPGASLALRRHLTERYPIIAGATPRRTNANAGVVPRKERACEKVSELTAPPRRRLRVYSGDPSLSASFATVRANEVTIDVRWESLEPGPVGEYLAVDATDVDGHKYDKLDLDDTYLLARDGWAPSAGNAQFHQQMVYGVVMKTVEHFEGALGRPVLWRPTPNPNNEYDDSKFTQHLTIRPHAVRQANAYYSPKRVALEFGYFDATPDNVDVVSPGTRVYTCLSHDIIAHEAAHAILDGIYRRYAEPTNPDVLAFHEAFADIVALMQHFTMRDLLAGEIARSRGDLRGESRLGSLAVEFGYAMGGRQALRNAIGRVEDGVWVRNEPDPTALDNTLTPHARGAILVAAVFDAFLMIYENRTQDLLRIYTGGTGVLPDGAIHPDLVSRLAGEASKTASHVLGMCIRALDYLPPVDVTFFEYLRALITADYDLVPDDPHRYRVTFVEAFRRRGIRPANLDHVASDTPRTLSVETLRWQTTDQSKMTQKSKKELEQHYDVIVKDLKRYADQCSYFESREALFHATREARKDLKEKLAAAFKKTPRFAEELGIDIEARESFEVHELRRAMRTGPDGRLVPQVIVALTQSMRISGGDGVPEHTFRGGSTLVVDLAVPQVRYRIVKRLASESRRARTAEFYGAMAADPIRRLTLGEHAAEPFAALHSLG